MIVVSQTTRRFPFLQYWNEIMKRSRSQEGTLKYQAILCIFSNWLCPAGFRFLKQYSYQNSIIFIFGTRLVDNLSFTIIIFTFVNSEVIFSIISWCCKRFIDYHGHSRHELVTFYMIHIRNICLRFKMFISVTQLFVLN